jgi:NADPH:quinone reductase-like Zn-dependent oxidoreductase
MTGFGGREVLRNVELPDPSAGPGQVVVDIHAASVNAADYKVRAGSSHYPDLEFPHILGRDFSGVVREVGPGTWLTVGDEVFGVCERGTDGGYAEQLAIPAAIVARKPRNLSHVEAAAAALAGLTALYGIEEVGRVGPGQQVLVQGGAGGVGSLAVQLAKHLGATVTATASGSNEDYLRELGADHVIDYHRTDFAVGGPRYDVVYDTVGGEVQRRSAGVVLPGGKLVYCAAGPEATAPSRLDIEVLNPAVVRDHAHLDRLRDLLETGALRPPAITEFPLSEAAAAHEISEGRHLRGKLVLVMRSPA